MGALVVKRDGGRLQAPIRWFGDLNGVEKCAATAIAAIAAAGIGLIGSGAVIHLKAVVAQVLLERAFASAITSGSPAKPWAWADTWPVARIEFPKRATRYIALHGTSGEALAFGPGHLTGTARPGEAGLSVFAAHRDTHFRELKHVRTGETIRVTRTDGATLTYRVRGARIVRWDRPDLDFTSTSPALALATCWPFDSDEPGPYRYVVEADLVDDPTQRSADNALPAGRDVHPLVVPVSMRSLDEM